jgi:primase-polymerase (primpol)-like protein
MARAAGPPCQRLGVVRLKRSGPPKPPGLTDDQVLELAARASDSPQFVELWRNQLGPYRMASEADLAMLCMLARHTRDPKQIERMMSQSCRGGRKYWQTHPSYRARQIAKAIRKYDEGLASTDTQEQK